MYSKITKKRNEIIKWIAECNGDVDRCTLKEECGDLVYMWAVTYHKALPACVEFATPMEQIDFICKMGRDAFPGELFQYRLPGIANVKRSMGGIPNE